jgi:hypothetical protein
MECPELITPVEGQVYLNRNGRQYRCISARNPERPIMQRLSDYWTLTAVRVRQFEDGTVEWDHSVDGHWPY